MMESWKKGYKTYTSTNFERVNSSHKCRSRRSANRLGIISFKNDPFRCQFIYIWRNNFFVVKSNIIPTFNFQKVIFKKYYNTNFTKMIIIEFVYLEKKFQPFHKELAKKKCFQNISFVHLKKSEKESGFFGGNFFFLHFF